MTWRFRLGMALSVVLLSTAALLAQGPYSAQIQAAIQALLQSNAVVSGNWTCTGTCTGFGGGGGTIGGSIANTQIAFGTGANTVGGSSTFTWNGTSLTVPSVTGYGNTLSLESAISDVDASTVTPVLAGAAGNVSNGTHRYKLIRKSGFDATHTGGTSAVASASVTVTNNAVDGQVTVPLQTVGFSMVESAYHQFDVYRDKNSDGVYKLVVAGHGTYFAFTDNVADGSLGATIPSTNTTLSSRWGINADATLTSGPASGNMTAYMDSRGFVFQVATNPTLASAPGDFQAYAGDGWDHAGARVYISGGAGAAISTPTDGSLGAYMILNGGLASTTGGAFYLSSGDSATSTGNAGNGTITGGILNSGGNLGVLSLLNWSNVIVGDGGTPGTGTLTITTPDDTTDALVLNQTGAIAGNLLKLHIDNVGGFALVWHTGDFTLTGNQNGDLTVPAIINHHALDPFVQAAADATSITPDTSIYPMTYQANTQAMGTLTIDADAGSPSDGRRWILKIQSTNVQTFSWDTSYVGGTVALPTATTGGGKIDYFAFLYDGTNSKWDYVGTAAGF